ncbi:MAG: LamB/YcsF family protein [Pseudobacter sp.]|uniref:LamB/YcsF family protein n=1 Tax=Pseudobacter sp. TaxID=2045420 RepID=UPI003F7F311D
MLKTDINCDMGESSPLWDYSLERDLSILPFISSVNLACGYHAGDPGTMHTMVEAALKAGVAIGAHPSFPDRENFGRSNMQLTPEQIYDIVLYQLGALNAFLQVNGAILHHVKPHGALYNMAAKDPIMAKAIADAVYDFDGSLILYGLSGSELIETGRHDFLSTCSEVFADRTYQDDGSLTPRSHPDAMLHSQEASVAQVLQMVQQQTVQSLSGKTVPVKAETICIHGDGSDAVSFAKAIHNALSSAGIAVTSPAKI